MVLEDKEGKGGDEELHCDGRARRLVVGERTKLEIVRDAMLSFPTKKLGQIVRNLLVGHFKVPVGLFE
jgi:hypothetical protein